MERYRFGWQFSAKRTVYGSDSRFSARTEDFN